MGCIRSDQYNPLIHDIISVHNSEGECNEDCGVCCLPNGLCVDNTQTECTAANGIWNSGVTCDDVICPSPCPSPSFSPTPSPSISVSPSVPPSPTPSIPPVISPSPSFSPPPQPSEEICNSDVILTCTEYNGNYGWYGGCNGSPCSNNCDGCWPKNATNVVQGNPNLVIISGQSCSSSNVNDTLSTYCKCGHCCAFYLVMNSPKYYYGGDLAANCPGLATLGPYPNSNISVYNTFVVENYPPLPDDPSCNTAQEATDLINQIINDAWAVCPEIGVDCNLSSLECCSVPYDISCCDTSVSHIMCYQKNPGDPYYWIGNCGYDCGNYYCAPEGASGPPIENYDSLGEAWTIPSQSCSSSNIGDMAYTRCTCSEWEIPTETTTTTTDGPGTTSPP